MATHIFLTNEQNFEICIRKGLVGIPEPNDGKNQNNVFDAMLSRLAMIRENDYILMYITGSKELRGVWKVDGLPFYDETPVWSDRLYPFRCRIKTSEYCFDKPLLLNDINDLRNSNKIWTWSLSRATGTNAMFSISNQEFEIIVNEYLKINPFTQNDWRIVEPYPYHVTNILEKVHIENNKLKYESSVMTYLNHSFASGDYKELFGNYTDCLSYIPTNLGREMDILLMYEHPKKKNFVLSYDIIEVKRDEFDKKALTQLIDYESWFLQKKISGDMKMLRTTAIAKSFSEEVIDYVAKRKMFENKPIKLVKYEYNEIDGFSLNAILQTQ
ncbi:MAG: hypothetical protein ACI4JA_10425 [Oscillospiraceae bacterium]